MHCVVIISASAYSAQCMFVEKEMCQLGTEVYKKLELVEGHAHLHKGKIRPGLSFLLLPGQIQSNVCGHIGGVWLVRVNFACIAY